MAGSKEFEKTIELFKKSYAGSLSAQESEQFLKNKYLESIDEELHSGKLTREAFAATDFLHHAAFLDFEHRTRLIKRRRMALRFSAAAVVLITLSFSLLLHVKPTANDTVVAEQAIQPGVKKAELRLASGRVVHISDSQINVSENISCQDGVISYTDGGQANAALFNELSVPAGGECRVVFDDGTRVSVNSATTLKYPVRFAADERRVYLDGEAYFDVVPGNRPFIVSTSKGDILVLGTSFGVKAYQRENMVTTLVSGRVAYKGATTLEISPGEQLTVDASGGVSKCAVAVEEYVGWKDGLYVFTKKPLEQIMNDLKRWYDVDVTYESAELTDVLFSGDMKRYDTINTFLELLESTGSVRYKISGRNITFFR